MRSANTQRTPATLFCDTARRMLKIADDCKKCYFINKRTKDQSCYSALLMRDILSVTVADSFQDSLALMASSDEKVDAPFELRMERGPSWAAGAMSVTRTTVQHAA